MKRFVQMTAMAAIAVAVISTARADTVAGNFLGVYGVTVGQELSPGAGFFEFEYVEADSSGYYGLNVVTREGNGLWTPSEFNTEDVRYLDTFCIEKSGWVPPVGTEVFFEVKKLEDSPVALQTGPMGTTKAESIMLLWDMVEAGGVTVQPDPSGAAGLTQQQATAMQYAIWEILAAPEGGPWDLSSEPFVANATSTAVQDAQDLLDDLQVYTSTSTELPYLGGLTLAGTQDFVALFKYKVPEPSTAGLMLLGLLGLAARRRR